MTFPLGEERPCSLVSIGAIPGSAEEEGTDHASSPRDISEDCSSSSVESSETSSSKASSESEAHTNPKADLSWHGNFFRVLKKSSAKRFQTLPLLSVSKFPRKRKNKTVGETREQRLTTRLDTQLYCFRPSWKNFTLSELQTATDNFSHDNLIGEGGYAEVFKGIIEDGQHVAIKRLSRGTPEEITADFLSELGIIVHVDHPNTAKLIGYGVEGGMHIVLQLSPHGSLASLLQGSKEKLGWGIRYKIALGTARGLLYLHEGGQKRIIHRDIKASNVLLTENFEPQISDFGLARWLPDQCTHHTVSKFEGTFGYLPPEFFMHGIVDEKTDVFAYGVLLLELITGRLAVDELHRSLVMWAKPFLEKRIISELVDPFLANAYDPEEMNRLSLTAALCMSQFSSQRPRMSQVVDFLEGNDEGLNLAIEQHQSSLESSSSDEMLDGDDESTSCLNVLDEQM